MNIIINTTCNANCDYCFAKEKNLFLKKKEMSLKEFKDVLKFIKNSSEKRIKILGGEPTLHKNFKEFIILSGKWADTIQIFTNGFVDKRIVDFLKDKNVFLIVNFTARKFTKINKNKLDYFLRKLGNKSELGINYIGRLKISEINEIVKTIKKYNLVHRVRLGIASPIYDLSNNYFDFKKNKNQINKDLLKLSKILFKNRIKLSHDCSCFPICSLDDKIFSFTEKHNETKIVFICGKPIDVLPGKLVIRCFACSNFKFPLSQFKNIKEIVNYFHNLDQFLISYVKPKMCKLCKFESYTCQSGCLANRLCLLKELYEKSNYKFSKEFLYFKDKNLIALINKEDIGKPIILTDSGKEIFELMFKDIPKLDIIQMLSKKYQEKEDIIKKDINKFLCDLAKKGILLK